MGVGLYRDYGGEKKGNTHTSMTRTRFEPHAGAVLDIKHSQQVAPLYLPERKVPLEIETESKSRSEDKLFVGSERKPSHESIYWTPFDKPPKMGVGLYRDYGCYMPFCTLTVV
jgi:hypothetical protein